MPAERTFVIVGASLAGAKAAETLREERFDGRVMLLGAEPERPYERPPLSKDYLRGEAEREAVYVHDAGFYEQRDIELRTSTRVAAIQPHSSEVVLDDDERIRYDGLLLATGAEPRRLPIRGAELEGVLYLRSAEDSDAIRARLDRGGKVAVVGAGWIGSEVAASARQRGLEVALIDPGTVPLERVLGRDVGAFYRGLHSDHGVEFLGSSGVEAFEGAGSVERVVTSDGRAVDCDFAVVGIGVTPRVELARDADIACDDGILVDEYLETEAPAIFAAGDVANAEHPLFGERVRVEHWANALNQGPAAARNMLGRREPFARIPYFFSDQYEAGMEYTGHAVRWDRVVFRGDPAAGEFIAFWLEGNRVLAGMNVNVWNVTDPIQRLIRERVEVDDDRLADPAVPLEELVSAGERDAHGGLKQLFLDGVNFPRRLLAGRLLGADSSPPASLDPGEARVLQVDGDKVAVHRDPAGELHSVSAVCTHLGCIVEWDEGRRIWTCPCHGSHFDPDGKVLKGPAKRDLERKPLDREEPGSA